MIKRKFLSSVLYFSLCLFHFLIAMEQTKRAKEISKQLEEMEISYKQSCPYTSSWKSDEAIIEINSFKSKLDAVKEEASENEVERYIFPHHFTR